jgi:biofilm PGA synthesis N-glycosyltransferase PgaC
LTRNFHQGIFKFISKVCYVPYVFCLLNFSALVGFWKFILGTQQTTWAKARDI